MRMAEAVEHRKRVQCSGDIVRRFRVTSALTDQAPSGANAPSNLCAKRKGERVRAAAVLSRCPEMPPA